MYVVKFKAAYGWQHFGGRHATAEKLSIICKQFETDIDAFVSLDSFCDLAAF